MKDSKIVSKESATLQGLPEAAIHADHINMCKFKLKQDPDYKMVIDILKSWVQDVSKVKDVDEPDDVSFAPIKSGHVILISIKDSQGNVIVTNKGTNQGQMFGQQNFGGHANAYFGGKEARS